MIKICLECGQKYIVYSNSPCKCDVYSKIKDKELIKKRRVSRLEQSFLYKKQREYIKEEKLK